MRGSRKSKRISWASDGNLCQVRLFLSEDNPSQVGLGGQDHLQAKASWMLHSSGMGSDDNLPPGFEGTSPADQFRNKLPQIPLSKWRCPSRFVLNITWQVVAGEENKEVEVQNQREMRVLEAIYPRPSAIPPNPAVAMDIEGSPDGDDHHTILIPMTPIEEEDVVTDTLSNSTTGFKIPTSLQPPLLAPENNVPNSLPNESSVTGVTLGLDPDVLSAASAAATEMMKNSEQGALIDHDLLIKILSNPKLVEKLVADHGMAASTNPQAVPKPMSPQTTTLSDHVHINRMETGTSSSEAAAAAASTLNGSLCVTPSGVVVGHVPNAQPAPPGIPVPFAPPSIGLKDMNYYKSLIQKHGGERQDSVPQFNQQDTSNNSKLRDLKLKMNKPCIYFNSSKGCRHGAKCAYQHDASFQQEVQSAKRMKMDRDRDRDIIGKQSCS